MFILLDKRIKFTFTLRNNPARHVKSDNKRQYCVKNYSDLDKKEQESRVVVRPSCKANKVLGEMHFGLITRAAAKLLDELLLSWPLLKFSVDTKSSNRLHFRNV